MLGTLLTTKVATWVSLRVPTSIQNNLPGSTPNRRKLRGPIRLSSSEPPGGIEPRTFTSLRPSLTASNRGPL
ncbi:Uncharacterised protein [Mycobacteroides abscessus subsp. abscessus]|nr:Uncharacterised protein [Mycobacteroides abscessus subsp. abscessus]